MLWGSRFFPVGWVQFFAELPGAWHQSLIRVSEVFHSTEFLNVFHVAVVGVGCVPVSVMFAVFELLKEGEVLVVPTDNPMSEKEAWLAFRDVVHGLEYRKD